MPKPTPTLYNIQKTFIWFAVVSAILTASLAAIVLTDHRREWKTWQRKFLRLKEEKTKGELRQAEEKLNRDKLDELKKKHAEAETEAWTHKKDADSLRRKLNAVETKLAKAMTVYQDLKQYHDSYKYFFEEYRLHNDSRAEEYEGKLKALKPKLHQAKVEWEGREKEHEAAQKRLDDLTTDGKNVQKEIDKILAERDFFEKRIETLKPSLAKEVLDAPMLDFMAPTLKIQQVVLEDLYDDYHFAKTQKVDRCTTCHMGIDLKGFSAEGGPASGGEDISQPFRTHPKLDLYVGADSPHPVEKFGCTVCHGGSGHSVNFKDAAHTPQSQIQKEDWEKRLKWRELEKWETKMLPLNHIQAACAKCHQGVIRVPQADKLNEGRRLAKTLGCVNCHKISGENQWRVGPSLDHVSSKLDQEWIARWLHNPQDFRPSTKMPRVFHLSNTSSQKDIEKNNAAIESIAVYLVKNSEPVALTKPPVEGNPEKGEKLVKEIGCLGCHYAAGAQIDDFGPELSSLGSKVKADWLYTWLKNPKHYSKETRMPNLRLTDEQAADIASYLLTQKNEAFDQKPVPRAREEVVDGLIEENLQGTMRHAEIEEKLRQMNTEEKLQFLGQKSIAHQGCFACHAIKGFEDAKPIGTELSDEGRKPIHQFDFGFIHDIEHTRHGWITRKLKDTRGFDHGKVKDYYEKLRMPQFDLTDEEVEAITTFILSLNQEFIPLEMHKRLNLKELQVEKGRSLVSKLNCTGCHTLDGKTGSLRKGTEDPGAAPPILDGEGAKVHEKWLHEFLQNPAPIRPWLTYKMPTFSLTDEEAETLVRYFTILAGKDVSYKGLELPQTTPEKLNAGKKLFDALQCAKCHPVNPASIQMGASFLAPDLALAKKRLKPDWVIEWLKDPQKVESGTMMPTFFPDGETALPDILGGNAEEQVEAIRDYLYSYETAEATPAQ